MFNVYPTVGKGHMETRPQFISSSDRLNKPGIKPAIPDYKAHSGLFDRFCIDSNIMIVIVLSNVKKDEITHVFNNNCFSDCKQHYGLITDPA